MRARAFSARPVDLGIAPSRTLPRVWGAMMELGLEGGPATLVCLGDDSTVLLLSDAPPVRSGEDVAIRDANRRFLAGAEGLLELTDPVREPPLPARREVRFHVLTYDGVRSAAASGPELSAGGGPLFPLFLAGRDVLARLRALPAARSPTG